MNDEAIQKIISYANEYLFEPRSNWSKQAIMERSYERWAVDEILLTIMDHPLTEADFGIYFKNGIFSSYVGKSGK